MQWLSREGIRYWKSTGERVQPKLKKRGQEAGMIAAVKIVGSGLRSEASVLAEYAKDFYRWETSSFLKRQHAKGRGFNRAWANALQSMMEHHVFPRFGRMRLGAITRPMVENWLVELPLANQTRNQILYALRRILLEAEREGLILRNPLNHVEPMGKGDRVRDVFALKELRRMFPTGQEELLAVWKTLKYAALFITMATTGIREGEARALQWRHVLPGGWLLIERAVKIDGTIGPLKKRERTGEPRVVALPSKAQAVLSWWHQESPHTLHEDLIFFGDRADHPLNRRTFVDRVPLQMGIVRRSCLCFISDLDVALYSWSNVCYDEVYPASEGGLMKRAVSLALAILFLLLVSVTAVGQDKLRSNEEPVFSLTLLPGASLPLGLHTDIFGLGGGADLRGDFPLSFWPSLRLGPAIGYTLTTTSANTTISVLNAGAVVGVVFRLSPLFWFTTQLQGGYFYGFLNDQSVLAGIGSPQSGGSNPYAAGAVGIEYLLSPDLGLSLNVGYRMLFGFYNDIKLQAGLAYHVVPRTSELEKELRLRPVPLDTLSMTDISLDTVFPVFYKYYDDHPVGRARLSNQGKQALTKIKVSLYVPQYMDSPKQADVVDHLAPGEVADVTLFGLFTDRVLGITEGTKVSAQLIVEATGESRNYRNEVTTALRLYDRNALTWDDDRKAAAFITSKDPAVLTFSKNVNSVVKGKVPGTINQNLLTALGMFTAFHLYGLRYSSDPIPTFTSNTQVADYIQFPRQTLEYKGGKCSDFSILFSALLEAVGIETALITVPGHIFMAVSLDADPQVSRTEFSRPQDLIAQGGRTWLPLEVTESTGDFLKAWETGAHEWREFSQSSQAAFYPVHEAWKAYEPVAMPGEGKQPQLPDAGVLLNAFQQQTQRYVEREIGLQVGPLQQEISTGRNKAVPMNKLGILYARYGHYDKAREQFGAILAGGEYAPALINEANLYWLESNLPKAREFYERALALDSGNTTALLGMARVSHMEENYGSAREAYSRLKAIAPDLAARFAYLDQKGDDAVRAAEADRAKEVVVWQQ